MFSAIRKRVSYANVAMTVALVFAMSGGAYAAGKYLITSTKQIKPSVLAQLKGKSGARGAAGAPGATGLQGPAGPAGAAGKEGGVGKEGVAGKEGPQGPPGTNGTTGFTETLPKGKTLKGEWAMYAASVDEGKPVIGDSVSFGIPLSAAPTAVYVQENGTDPVGCTGNAADPGAEQGFLCVFAAQELNVEKVRTCALTEPIVSSTSCYYTVESSADKFGFGLLALAKETSGVLASGTWVVTAE